MRRSPGWPHCALGVACAVALAAFNLGCEETGPPLATLSVTEILADADTAGFARAEGPRLFSFPEDHGPHPEFRHEWWYFTGNVDGIDGRRFGFQLTFFRSALRPGTSAVDSEWATNQAYMGHFALSDIDRGTFRAFERFDRGAAGLAGARATPFQVHVGDWLAREVPGHGSAPRFPPIQIVAAEGDVSLSLLLTPVKPVVFQGDAGWSLKGPEPGNASYYYSLTRLDARGTLHVAGEEIRVSGLAWLDREWSTSALGPDLEGWDWFSLQLDDGSELMYYRLRRRDGTTDPHSRGSFVHPAGGVTPLQPADVALDPTGQWRSPRGALYPSGWELRVATLGLELEILPSLADQEVDLSFRYWEGAVSVRGRRAGVPVRGRGYVELTGYAERHAQR
jgi:predicted secreted hydrolase